MNTTAEKKSPLAMILGNEKFFSPESQSIVVPTAPVATSLAAPQPRDTRAIAAPPRAHFPLPIPCILCDTPAIWESVYSTPDAPQFACITCEPPPAPSLVRAKHWLLLIGETWIWAPYGRGPSETPLDVQQARQAKLADLSPVEAAWERFWRNPRLIQHVELEWRDEGFAAIRSRTHTIAPPGRDGDAMLAAAKERVARVKIRSRESTQSVKT